MTDQPEPPDALAVDDPAPSRSRVVAKVAFRVVLVVGILVVAGFALLKIFDDLDFAEVRRTLGSLSDADWIALVAVWLIWVTSQGMQSVAMIRSIPVRRGILAYLGPASVTAIVPGPSDLPVRHKMFRSWGVDPATATLSVAAGGIFNIGIKLVLPVMAAAVLVVSETPIEGTTRLVVIIATLVAVGLVAATAFLVSERWSVKLSNVLGRLWAGTLRMMRRPEPDDLGERLLGARANAIGKLRERWHIAAWSTVLTAFTKFALMLLCLRLCGVTEADVSWSEAFVAYGIVNGLTVFPITPGDVGVSEIALIGMLGAAAGPDAINQVTAGIFLYRLATWLVIMPVGWATLLAWQAGMRRSARAAAQAGAPG
jgi:uncharacterized membrane protein YbhN (UPF0104 family)